MVKYFLKNTEQEVNIGNTVVISVPAKTPYGGGKCEVEVLVTQAILDQLVKDGLVEARELKPVFKAPDREIYKPFIRRLARRMKVNFEDALDFLGFLLEASPYAHKCLLVELMADVYNKEKKFGETVYIVDMTTNKPLARTVGGPFHSPAFADFLDAERACALMIPFVSLVNGGK